MFRRRLPSLRLLVVFETIQRCGGIRRAANELNVTQPAVSQALRQLEDQLGVPLLDRTTRPARLTEAGRILDSATTEGLDRIARAVAQIEALQAPSEASLTVACTVGTATYWLMPELTRFFEHHSHIPVNVRTTAQGIPALLPGTDLAIRYGRGTWSDGRSVRLFRERVAPVCTPELRDRLWAGVPPDLTVAPLLHVDAGIRNWMDWAHYLAQVGLPISSRPGLRFTNYVQATQAALAGQGVMLGWRSNVSSFLARSDLVELPLPAVTPEDAFYGVMPARKGQVPEPVRTLVDWLTVAGATLEETAWS